jgi:hypothetical protein
MGIPERIAAIIITEDESSTTGRLDAERRPLSREVERRIRGFRDSGVEDVRVVAVPNGAGPHPLAGESKNDAVISPSLLKEIRNLSRSASALFILPTGIQFVRPSTFRDLATVWQKSAATVVRPALFGCPGSPCLISMEALLEWNGAGGLESFLKAFESRTIDVEVADRFIFSVEEHGRRKAWEHYSSEFEIPSAEECKVLLVEKCGVDRDVLLHSLKVAQVAHELCLRLNERGRPINEKLAQAAALLHDLARGPLIMRRLGPRY